MAEPMLVEAVTHRDAGHRVDAETANMSAAKRTDMRASKAANVSTTKAANMSNAKTAAEAADMTAAEAAANTTTATRKGGTGSRRQSEQHGHGNRKNFSVHQVFHDLSPLFVRYPDLPALASRSVVDAAPDRAAARQRLLLLRLGMHIILHQVHIGPGGECRGGEKASDQ
jgi:hypothetical protein